MLNIKLNSKNSFETTELGHGRKETRKCTVKKLTKKNLSELDEYYLKLKRPTWEGLKSICKVESSRTLRGKKSKETRYYLTSRDLY